MQICFRTESSLGQTAAVGCFRVLRGLSRISYNSPPERPQDYGPASAIKREVLRLIDLQIEALRQESSLDPSQVLDYQARSAKIRTLYADLDRIGRSRTEFGFARIS